MRQCPEMVLPCGIVFPSKLRPAFTVGLLGLLGIAQAVQADEEAGITTQLIAEVRESSPAPNGGTVFRFIPATVLSQGQIVYYTVRITNPTPVAIRDVTVVQRVPANTTYVPRSASAPAAAVSLSTDGGQTFAPEAPENVRNERPASEDRCTHIRWKLRYPLAPGATALARFEAVFD